MEHSDSGDNMHELNLDDRTVELLVTSTSVLGSHEEAQFLRTCLRGEDCRRERAVTRQARHKRAARAIRRATMNAVAMAIEDKNAANVFLSPSFVKLRPLSAGAHRALQDMTQTRYPLSASQGEKLWNLGASKLYDLALRLDSLQRDELLCIHSALFGMYAGSFLFGNHLAPAWRDFMKMARGSGILRHRHLVMQLAIVGAQTGECGHLVDWTLDPGSRALDWADVLLCVREDYSEDLLDSTALSICGEQLDPLRCLYGRNNVSTLTHMAAYARFCMMNQGHFANEGQMLMVLSWVHELCRFATPAQRANLVRPAVPLLKSIAKIRSVQIRRSGRYQRTVESLTPSRVRRQIESWWEASLGGHN